MFHNFSYEICLQMAKYFLRKKKKIYIWMTFDQGQEMTLTMNTHVVSFTHLAHCIYQFSDRRLQ